MLLVCVPSSELLRTELFSCSWVKSNTKLQKHIHSLSVGATIDGQNFVANLWLSRLILSFARE